MAVSDAVIGNLTTIYVVVIAAIKVYGLVSDRNFGAVFVLAASTAVVGVILVGALAWVVSRKAITCTVAAADRRKISPAAHEMCKGGICWHGVAIRAPASQVRFRLPQHIRYGSL